MVKRMEMMTNWKSRIQSARRWNPNEQGKLRIRRTFSLVEIGVRMEKDIRKLRKLGLLSSKWETMTTLFNSTTTRWLIKATNQVILYCNVRWRWQWKNSVASLSMDNKRGQDQLFFQCLQMVCLTQVRYC